MYHFLPLFLTFVYNFITNFLTCQSYYRKIKLSGGDILRGTVFSIEEFSVFDGPGIRTSVFLKGCPLRCAWCHNPEGQKSLPEIIRNPNGCLGCGRCETNATRENGRLVYTKASIKSCPKGLLRVCGEELCSEELVSRVLKNETILAANGGVTFSGGEPLMQSEFLIECLSLLHGRLHTAVQTSGFAEGDVFDRVLSLADHFLFDIKLIDPDMHEKYTGVKNELILRNFEKLAESGNEFVIRVPLIPTVTDTEENATAIAKLLRKNRVNYVELLPYNKMAGGKYAMLGRSYAVDFDETLEPQARTEIFKKYGISAKIF